MSSAALGVIDEARGRHHRRVVSIAAASGCVAVAIAFAIGRAQSPVGGAAHTTATIRVAPAALFARPPDAGVACRTRACDSLGLTIWLRRPALSIVATIGAYSFHLTTAAARPYAVPWHAGRTVFVGYLTPLRLVTHLTVGGGPPVNWPTPHDPDPLVSLRVNEGGGRILLTRLHVPVQPGWG